MTASTPPKPRLDASMTLITEMMERPLDPGYAAAARRREAAGQPPSTGLRSPLLLLSAVLAGLLFASAAVSLRLPETAATRAKADLIAQIDSRRARVEQQSARIASMRAQIDAAQQASLRLSSQGGVADALASLELMTGVVAVTGPGVRLTVDDAESQGGSAPNADPQQVQEGKVISRDLQIVVNGLWQAGAEAIAVNGHRLTARSAIRFAGEAILVDYRPLTRPYVLSAIGDPQSLSANFATSEGGGYLQSLETNFAIRVEREEVDHLTLPGRATLSTRSATALGAVGRGGSGTGAPSPAPSTTSTADTTTAGGTP